MEISTYVRPQSLEEAYSLLADKKAFLIGGGAWSRMNSRKVELAVDLSSLDLRFIKKSGTTIEIGAMTTVRDLETSTELNKAFNGLFQKAVAHIVGVQMRNLITVGGTVGGKFGFSDLNTVLLGLDAKVALYKQGEIDFEKYLTGRTEGPALIEKLIIDTDKVHGAYAGVRISRTDFSILNACAVCRNGAWRIAVGARPGSARLSVKAAEILGTETNPDEKLARKAGEAASQELDFGNDVRGTAEYRTSVSRSLVKRAIQEVAK
jgi:CO/xanthine dehydrogenase FAD-binding subunit